MDQQSSIQLLAKDELGHILSFIGLCDQPFVLRLRETCRHFSNEIDWGLIIQNCALGSPLGSPGMVLTERRLQIMYNHENFRQRFISHILSNPTLDGTVMMNVLLVMAVNQNDTETVQRLLAEETCTVYEALDSALIRDNTEIAAILQNDHRVRRLIVMCSECNDNPGCVGCKLALSDGSGMCVDPHGLVKKYCKACTRDKLCSVCFHYQCEGCQYYNANAYKYHPCSTCGKTACEFLYDTEQQFETCFQKCNNYDELCQNIQCNNCAKEDSDLRWYQCAADSGHVFCQECNPDIVKYDVDLENGQSSCPACQDKCCVRQCFNSHDCGGKLERDTLEGSSDWYRCPDTLVHMYCPICNPTTPGRVQDDMIKQSFDIEKCLACQELERMDQGDY